jgi:mercuric ion binding protein
MKAFILAIAMLIPVMGMAAEQTISFDVAGNCNSCRKKIVKAAEKVDGVEEADWDSKTKKFTATFDDEVASKATIVKAILKAGYDVGDQKADDKAYSRLPDCCQYRDGGHD